MRKDSALWFSRNHTLDRELLTRQYALQNKFSPVIRGVVSFDPESRLIVGCGIDVMQHHVGLGRRFLTDTNRAMDRRPWRQRHALAGCKFVARNQFGTGFVQEQQPERLGLRRQFESSLSIRGRHQLIFDIGQTTVNNSHVLRSQCDYDLRVGRRFAVAGHHYTAKRLGRFKFKGQRNAAFIRSDHA